MRTLTSCTKKVVLYLTLDQHSHVHEHVVQLLDGGLQLDDVRVPRLDVCQRLLCCSCVHDDTLRAGQASKKRMKGKNEWSNSCIVYMYLIQPEGQKYLYSYKFDPFSLSCNQIHLPKTHYTYKIFQDYFYKIIIFFTCVKTAGLPCSNISSNSSLVVVRPAEQKDLTG